MECTDILGCFIATEEVESKSTSSENDSRFPLLFMQRFPRLTAFWIRMGVLDQVRKLERVLSQVEKNDMLRSVFGRYIEGLIHAALSISEDEYLERTKSTFISSWKATKPIRDLAKCLKSLVAVFLSSLSSGLGFVDNAIVSAIVLSIVFQYLVAYVDKGGTKTYNPGSLEFRASYVSLLLFQGAYVWIKFREVAQRTVRRRHKKDKSGKVLRDELGQVQYYDKWEPRFKPPREKGAQKHDYLPLGGYDTEKDAEVVCQIAGFYYGKDDGVVVLEDGFRFPIPEILSQQERRLCGEEKRKWVSAKAREVFELLKKTAAREQPQLSADAGDQVDGRGSPSADESAGVAFPIPTTSGIDGFVEGLSTPAGELGPSESVGDEEILSTSDIPRLFFLEEVNERLHLQKMQLEADFNQRLESLMEQNAEQYRHLEVGMSELRQENKRLKSTIQEVAETLLCNLQY